MSGELKFWHTMLSAASKPLPASTAMASMSTMSGRSLKMAASRFLMAPFKRAAGPA